MLSRVSALDWNSIESSLDERGYGRLPGLLTADECAALVRAYPEDSNFRSTIDMQQHRFGVGEYRYFSYPLPGLIRMLRNTLYPRLSQIANRWQAMLGEQERYPARLPAFLARCHEQGQARPTPLLLRYEAGGYNCLHQDLYGRVAFPLQVACLLSRPAARHPQPGPEGAEDPGSFGGGEFLLTEQRPRMQSRGEAIVLEQGEGLVFPNRDRPATGARGAYRVRSRHGVSRIHNGERYALGIIFHDAE